MFSRVKYPEVISKLSYSPVVEFDPAVDRLLAMDFTESNHELTFELLENTALFSENIANKIANAGARYGIGGYAEHRTVYSRSRVFDDPSGGEPRRLHLGTDIWGPVGTPVSTPLDGHVHSVGFNHAFGDYGATIILEHTIEEQTFFTLYGHLSKGDLGIQPGQFIPAGKVFAHFGAPAENGFWPPHLHFQVILDMQGWHGDFPGVCRFSEKEAYLSNCPDPDAILRLNQYLR